MHELLLALATQKDMVESAGHALTQRAATAAQALLDVEAASLSAVTAAGGVPASCAEQARAAGQAQAHAAGQEQVRLAALMLPPSSLAESTSRIIKQVRLFDHV